MTGSSVEFFCAFGFVRNFKMLAIGVAILSTLFLTFTIGAEDGVITIHHGGSYGAKIITEYKLFDRSLKEDTDKFYAGISKDVRIPSNATDVSFYVKVPFLTRAVPNLAYTILAKAFPGPVKKCYRLLGPSFYPYFEECTPSS